MDPIVAKIEKLLALATSSNEHEARLAAAKANELLIRHNLQDRYSADPRLRTYTDHTLKIASRPPPEHLYVQSILNEHFFVKVVTVRGPRRVHLMVYGTPANVAVAKYVYAFLCRSFRGLWADYRKARRAPMSRRKRYWWGLYSGLHAQLRQQRHRVETEVGAIVENDSQLDAHVNAANGGSPVRPGRTVKRPRVTNSMADGFADGRNLRIHGAVEHQSESAAPRLIEHQSQF